MDTVRFGNIMRATAVEQNAIAESECRAEQAEAGWEAAELELQAVRAQLREMERLCALQQREITTTRAVAAHILARSQRVDASVQELCDHLQPTLHEADRKQRFLVRNAYEAMGAVDKAAGVAGGQSVRAVG
jgi:chromosome segregation ATPase